jgi:hypothetical protein
MRRRFRSLGAVIVLGTVALEGCAGLRYPVAHPAQGQDAATLERDADDCRRRAREAVESPVITGLGTKVLWALGGAVFGAGVVVSSAQGGNGEALALSLGIGAGVGFVLGSIAGTFKGLDDASRRADGRNRVFTRCMTERGYRVE